MSEKITILCAERRPNSFYFTICLSVGEDLYELTSNVAKKLYLAGVRDLTISDLEDAGLDSEDAEDIMQYWPEVN